MFCMGKIKNHSIKGQVGYAESMRKRFGFKVDDNGVRLRPKRELNREQDQPSFGFISNKLKVPENAFKAFAFHLSPIERLTQNRIPIEKQGDLDALINLHLKNLAMWRRKGAITPQVFDINARRAWQVFQECKRGVSIETGIRANSWVELMRKLVLEQGEGYYQSKYKK